MYALYVYYSRAKLWRIFKCTNEVSIPFHFNQFLVIHQTILHWTMFKQMSYFEKKKKKWNEGESRQKKRKKIKSTSATWNSWLVFLTSGFGAIKLIWNGMKLKLTMFAKCFKCWKFIEMKTQKFNEFDLNWGCGLNVEVLSQCYNFNVFFSFYFIFGVKRNETGPKEKKKKTHIAVECYISIFEFCEPSFGICWW